METTQIQEEEIVLTAQGRQRIEEELDRLVTVERHEVAARIRDAKDYGELTENAEYEAAKNAQAFVEGRIIDLKSILVRARALRYEDIPTDYVGLGGIVTIQDKDFGDDWTVTLVSSFEADPDNDLLSDESPIGKALLRKRVGDTVEVKTPDGIIRYEITSITK
ncbi:transcription elongation factor GreA [Armatimonas rosea]|uniref:Transcription elongation factor GreA n=1 Tax=Armatimonas rosea TaxID=685828 RepID=A0A7W9W7C0_ARMRO|nr:transcription elongation factor GreA [Armatimonas rosea]MBB6050940.1 transcription elongation factor GreA [Armatimonas rosea]